MEIILVKIGKTKRNYSAIVEGLDGFVCTSKTLEGLKKEVEQGVKFHLDGLIEDNDPIPEFFTGDYKFEYELE